MCYYFDQFPHKPPRKIVNINRYSVKVKQVKKALQLEVIFNLYCRSNVVNINLKVAFFSDTKAFQNLQKIQSKTSTSFTGYVSANKQRRAFMIKKKYPLQKSVTRLLLHLNLFSSLFAAVTFDPSILKGFTIVKISL